VACWPSPAAVAGRRDCLTEAPSRPPGRTQPSIPAPVQLLSEGDPVHFDDVVGENVTVRLEAPDGSMRCVNGLVSGFAQCASQGRYTACEATVVPWLWLLTRTTEWPAAKGSACRRAP